MIGDVNNIQIFGPKVTGKTYAIFEAERVIWVMILTI